MACWQKLWGTFTSQAEEVRAVVTKVAAAVGEPLKEQVKRSVDDLREANLSGLRPRWEYSHGDQLFGFQGGGSADSGARKRVKRVT
jgi:hypothetical protein